MHQEPTYNQKKNLTGILAFGVAFGIGVSACSKKSSSDTSSDTESDPTTNIQVTGQLNLASFQSARLAMTLAGETALKGWTLINGVYMRQNKNAEDIVVASDGSFTWDVASSVSSFGDSESNNENSSGNSSTKNISGIITTYIKTGNLEAEATSMKFIGMPSGTEALSGIPTDSLASSSLNVGTVSATSGSDDAKGDIPATGSLFDRISDTGVSVMARTDDALKIVKNAHMNENWTAEPFYLFTHTAGYSDGKNQYSSAVLAYTGAGFYVGSQASEFTWSAICPAGNTGTAGTIVSLTPPSAVTTNSGSKTVLDNSGTLTRSSQGDASICGGDMFYARDDSQYGSGSIMLNFAAGGGITSAIPSGIWRLKNGATEIGRFDLGISKPVDSSNHLKIFTVKVKHTDSNSVISKIEAQFYRYDGATSSYVQVTDVVPLKKLISDLQWEGSTNSGGNVRQELIFDEATGIASATLTTPFSYLGSTLQNSGISYKIGSSTYRFEFR